MEKCIKCDLNVKYDTFANCKVCIQKALDKPEVIFNDLLAYVNSYRGSCGETKLLNACLLEFNDEDICVAKTTLFEEFKEILGEPQTRIGSKIKEKRIFNLEDIFEAFKELKDRKKVSVICASTNLRVIPKYNPEELEDKSMLQRIINIEKILNQHSTRLDENLARVAENKNDIEASSKSITNMQNEVQTSIKISNEARVFADIHKSDVDELKTKIDSGNMPTWC